MRLPTPPHSPEALLGWVADHLGDLHAGPTRRSPRFAGGQIAADRALARFRVRGYARSRNEVWPEARRGASALSPYIRHGLLHLRRVWQHVEGGPAGDVRKLRDELLWQEYARHLYARLGGRTARGLRAEPRAAARKPAEPWSRELRCVALARDELERDGWLVNQARMWLASHWAVRRGAPWQEGEDAFFRELLDGSRAANRLGWQWTVGAATRRPYGFSRWQVEKRAPGLCEGCHLRHACPIEHWPQAPASDPVAAPPALSRDPDPARTAGPAVPERLDDPDAVWLTAESLGDDDPALAARPDLPALFVFDEPLLRSLRLSGKRIVFLAECLADLATRRELEVHRGEPAVVLAGRRPAVTFAPVPGFRRLAARLGLAEIHPWPWLCRPHDGSLRSYSSWRKGVEVTP